MELLNDENFNEKLLLYQQTVFEFIKQILRRYSAIFNGIRITFYLLNYYQ